jgi:hypothetical protein
LIVPAVPSAARNLKVNDPFRSGKVVTTRLVVTRAVGFETSTEPLAACGTVASASGAIGDPVHAGTTNARPMKMTTRPRVARQWGREMLIAERRSNNVA